MLKRFFFFFAKTLEDLLLLYLLLYPLHYYPISFSSQEKNNWTFFYYNKIFILKKKIYFRVKTNPIWKAIWADNTSFDEVLISKRMVQDHMPDNVLLALTQVSTYYIQ